MSIDTLFIVAGAVAGFLVGSYMIGRKRFDEHALLAKAEHHLKNAEYESKRLVDNTRVSVVAKKKQFESEQQELAAQLDRMEKIIGIKANLHQKRELKLTELQRALQLEEKQAYALRSETNGLQKTINDKLVQITGLPFERLKAEVIQFYENAFGADAETRQKRYIEWTEECASREAKNITAQAMYRFAAETSVEHDLGVVVVSRDEIKGRLVGRGGHTIAFFEELFGVDVVFNDEPNTIIVSSFNLVQREIARAALQRLVKERNITEDVIKRIQPLAKQDIEKVLRKEGEAILKILGLHNMPVDFAQLIGRLKFRTSYGQNILRHSFEVAYFSKLMAAEIGADQRTAFVSGFLHDIGKSIDQEVGGAHDVLTKEILEKYGFAPDIIHAAWTHHDAAPIETVEARIVQAADAISAGRPGARAESVERYLAKIKDLQETATSFEGVKKAFAINAGREVRVVVEPEKIDDAGVNKLASDIAVKVQEKGGYPGKIKVTTIRITKVTDYAK